MSSRRCHLNIITSTTKAEREQPWFLNKEPSEVMITCFSLEAQETHDQFSPISGSVSSSLEDIAQHILQINRILYGPTFKTHLVFVEMVIVFDAGFCSRKAIKIQRKNKRFKIE